jgi:hypothetical protein
MDITPEYINQQCAHAEWLSIQAREAHIRGDLAKADELRDKFGEIYDRLEAQLGYTSH